MLSYRSSTAHSIVFLLPFTVDMCSKGAFTKDVRGTNDSRTLSSLVLVHMLFDSVFVFCGTLICSL